MAERAGPAVHQVAHHEVDFGDTSIDVSSYSDGMTLIEVGDTTILLNADQLRELTDLFVTIAKERSWVT